jgi:hypothetical protein
VIAVAIGLALFAVALILVVAFAAGAAWTRRVSLLSAAGAVAFGLALVPARHESGALIAVAAVLAILVAAPWSVPAEAAD